MQKRDAPEIIGNGGSYKYELGIGHEIASATLRERDRCRVEYERLSYDNQPLLKFELGEVQFDRDNHFIIVRIIPSLMPNESNQEEMHLNPQIKNFVSWYRYLSQDQGKVAEISNILKANFENFYKIMTKGKLLDIPSFTWYQSG